MNDAEKPVRSNNRLASVVTMTMIFGVQIAIIHHPVSSGAALADKITDVSRLGSMAQFVHSAIMVMLICLNAAMMMFSRQVDRDAFAVIVASKAYTFGIALCLIAMAFDGFVFPALADHCAGKVSTCADALQSVFTLSSEVVQAFTRVSFMAIALAVLLWSGHLAIATRRWKLATAGLLSVVFQFTALATVAVRLTPHSLLFVIAGQMIWYCGVAIFLWKRDSVGAAKVGHLTMN